MPEIKLFNDPFLKIDGDRETLRGGLSYTNTDGTACFIFFGPLKPLGEFSYGFQWIQDKGTYELIFGGRVWEDLFKTSDLVRQYLDLVLNNLISYKNRVDRLLK